MKKINKQSQQVQSLFYYVLRVARCVSLFMAAGFALLTYVWHFANSLDIGALSFVPNLEFSKSEANYINDTISKGSDVLSVSAISWAIVLAGTAVIMFLLLPRVRKFEKRLLVDSVVYSILIIFAVIMVQPFLRSFLTAIS